MQSNLFLTLSQIPTQILISSGSTGFSQHCYKQGTPLRTVFSVCFPTTIINSQLMKLLFIRLYFYNAPHSTDITHFSGLYSRYAIKYQ